MKRNNFELYKNDNYLNKDWVVPYSQITRGSSIVLYGAGDVGQAYYSQISLTNYCKIIAWVDQSADIYRRIGLDVKQPDQIDNNKCDYILIAVADSKNAIAINSYLLSKGIQQEKIIWKSYERRPFIINPLEYYLNRTIREEVYRVLDYKKIDRSSSVGHKYCADIISLLEDGEKVVIPRLVVQLTQKCTLKCKSCNNLMQYYEEPVHFDVEEIIRSLELLMSKVDRVLIMELIGGEPFIYPELKKIIKYLQKKGFADYYEITTNGTVLPSEEIFDELKRLNVCIRISEYEKSIKKNNIIEKCKEYNIKYEELENLSWIDSKEISERKLNDSEMRTSYSKCPSVRYCKTLSNCKIFCCARAASLYDLCICKDSSNYIDLLKCEKNDIRDFYLINKAKACDYCTCTDEWRKVIPGIQR